MEPIKPLPIASLFSRERILPVVEGLILASIVLGVLAAGGEVVRASYHGLLHSTLGDAVMRQGYLPENPYHAGVPLRYYTLYPWLGVKLGSFLGGSLWGFAAINVMAAFLFGPALDALGRALDLRFHARRAAFWAAILGFHGLGWLALQSEILAGAPPVMALREMVLPDTAFAWDARLQAFLPKFFNVSSFAISLPFGLSALAAAIRIGGRPLEVFAPLAFALALNPLVGAYVALVVALWKIHTLLSGSILERLRWPFVGFLAFVFAGISLLPLFHAAPTGQSLTGGFAGIGSPLFSLIGPSFLLIVLSFWGFPKMPAASRSALLGALVLAGALAFLPLPWANQYKLARLFALLLALPAGVALARFWSLRGWFRAGLIALALLCVPTTLCTIEAYLKWGKEAAPLPLQTVDGVFQIRDPPLSPFPDSIARAEAEAAPDAVLWMHPSHPATQAKGAVAQGNVLAPLFHHSLFVDRPQIHNDRQADLQKRLDLSAQLWGDDLIQTKQALSLSRALLPNRPFLIMTHESADKTVQALSAVSGAELLAAELGWQLWRLPNLK